ncbi:AraC-like DNA-binding protein [Breznakia sp. PF5-3]|uniref:AraC family transcriptional regulator n=1 Tax=unclassified Breznakia TaxID=2623764 RepID=UPI00240651EF|nr:MULTISPECIES: AraC family transcriptional regulator [unclassified Breznakia]MDL2276561.1 AraC family transcriptional regulator [Breznakia sp. OttesenSCG-928-G09]MDF9825493.1 AraC-like DNA-binding protein [Breznakia sp. PM6-1]MDF9836339.1 AraC-like DNA-binding protein [Breznakia sp. PF5-3]MDF9838187.1 AraC-like DNA-binding protein [Breznakia sp. PFB2-8]MDF9860220.1 AraC-like DNA-binding protein [Breznakia sp. PH5-24]
MFNKTTSFIFQKYGEIFQDLSRSRHKSKPGGRKINKISNKKVNFMYCNNDDTYIRVDDGIVMLVVTTDIETAPIEQFVIHRVIKIKAGIYFNFISITNNSKIEISSRSNISNQKYPLSETFAYERIIPNVEIKEVLACYYQVRNANYNFAGESHDHWELTFIDNGQLETSIDGEFYTLKNYDLILYGPRQYHTQHTTANNSCSYLTVMFDMECNNPEELQNRVFNANRETLNAINNFVRMSNNETVYNKDLMICYLKETIIKLLHTDLMDDNPVANTPMQQKFENELLNEILLYINDNIYTAITIEKLCQEFSISRSSLQQLFKNNLNTAPKQYISDLKLKKSKLLIKESKYTISEISNILGFASIHYFSRKFKQQFGITPTDYAKTIYN